MRPGTGVMGVGAAIALIGLFARVVLHAEVTWIEKVENYVPTWYFILAGTVMFLVGLVDLLRSRRRRD